MAFLQRSDDSMCAIRISRLALIRIWPHCWHLLFFVDCDMTAGLLN